MSKSTICNVVVFSITTIGNSCILYIHKDAFLTSNAFVGTCIMASSTLGMLRFHYCILYCGICLVCINVAMILQHFYHHNQNDDQNDLDGNCYDLKYTLLNTNFFLILFVYFSFFFCYVMELHLRQRYRDTGTIFRWTTATTTATSASTRTST